LILGRSIDPELLLRGKDQRIMGDGRGSRSKFADDFCGMDRLSHCDQCDQFGEPVYVLYGPPVADSIRVHRN
jgi:hypothetical protein